MIPLFHLLFTLLYILFHKVDEGMPLRFVYWEGMKKLLSIILKVSSVELILILSNTILVVGGIRGNILVRMKTLGDDILSYTL